MDRLVIPRHQHSGEGFNFCSEAPFCTGCHSVDSTESTILDIPFDGLINQYVGSRYAHVPDAV